jgi:hypothetical protein
LRLLAYTIADFCDSVRIAGRIETAKPRNVLKAPQKLLLAVPASASVGTLQYLIDLPRQATNRKGL